MTYKNRFLFYDNAGGEPEGWGDTLEFLSSEAECRDHDHYVHALTKRLVEFATEFRLSGNVWQHWLTYVLMMHENPFSLACERRNVEPDATMLRLVLGDLDLFRELMSMGPEAFTDYRPPYAAETGFAGAGITALSSRLSSAADAEEFGRILTDHYAHYGTGIYGLYKAFRVSDDTSGNGADGAVKLVPVTDSADVTFGDLIGCEQQKKILCDNTEAFIEGIPANNVLLYGDSGTGKSTSVHALMHDYYDRGLRLVEVAKQHRGRLPQVLASIKKRNYRFIIFLDDLSFEENESDYKELKAMLEGALETRSDRVLIYATSNRRHLIRETWRDRKDMEYQEDIHHSDTMEEKLSLASRFGVTIYYSKPDAKEYLHIVRELAASDGLEISEEELMAEARKWELRHGGMSGRTARQFVTWIGSRPEEHN